MLLNIITQIKELSFKPGCYFYYANTNYVLLAAIVEKVSGMPFAQYLQQHILDPLQMEHTTVNTDTYKTIKNRAIGYQEEEGIFYKTHMYGLLYAGDGQLITNAQDMFKWHQNLKQAKVGNAALWQKMHTKAVLNDGSTINSGLGVEFETYKGHQAMGFDGMITSGFVSKYLYFPKLDLAFFSTQNTFEEDFEERFFKLVDLYLPQQKNTAVSPTPTIVDLNPKQLKKYEGTYLFFNNDEYRKANQIKIKNGALQVLDLDGDLIKTLYPIGNDQFLFGLKGDALISFSFDQDGPQYTYDDLEHEKPWIFKPFEPYTHSKEALKAFEGNYYNKTFQISKRIALENEKLYFYYRNGAWKEEMASLSKDILEIPISPIVFKKDAQGQVVSFELMGLTFDKH